MTNDPGQNTTAATPPAGEQEVIGRDQVPAARRLARQAAQALGFDGVTVAEVETAASELATNLAKHGRYGRFQVVVQQEPAGLCLEAADQGPGIADPGSALAGGSSTGGTLGIGLSGLGRLMDDVFLETGAGAPTRIRAWKWRAAGPARYAAVATCHPGETVCGDGFFVHRRLAGDLFGVADGLGHGAGAHQATARCLAAIAAWAGTDLLDLVRHCHRVLKHERGVALALCHLVTDRLLLHHLGVGNVETRILGTSGTQLERPFNFNGTLGMRLESGLAPRTYRLAKGALVVQASDGLKSGYTVPAEDLSLEPLAVAGRLHQRYLRGTDDATVLVARIR